MGHDILYCDFCNTPVMEGHNDWKCDCGGYCGPSSQYRWKKRARSVKGKKEKAKSPIEMTATIEYRKPALPPGINRAQRKSEYYIKYEK